MLQSGQAETRTVLNPALRFRSHISDLSSLGLGRKAVSTRAHQLLALIMLIMSLLQNQVGETQF